MSRRGAAPASSGCCRSQEPARTDALRLAVTPGTHAAEALPGVWLGDRRAASDVGWLRSAGVRAVVNATAEEPNALDGELAYCCVRLEDNDAAAGAMAEALDGAVAFLREHVARAGLG